MTRLDLRSTAPDHALALLRQAMGTSSALEIVSWRLPERNLDYPAVAITRLLSIFCRWPHKAHLAAGGIEGLWLASLLDFQSEWRVQSRSPVFCGAATQLCAEKIQKKD